MLRTNDPLTYVTPRTIGEVIARHPCTGREAIAGWRYRRPLRDQIANGVAVGLMVSLLLACVLDYFGVLVK